MRYSSKNRLTVTEAAKYIGKSVSVTFLTDWGLETHEGIFSSVFEAGSGGIYSVGKEKFCNEDVIILKTL